MWILSDGGDRIINTNNVSVIEVDTNMNNYEIYADTNYVGTFQTEDDAKKELKHIYDALIAGQESYSVG